MSQDPAILWYVNDWLGGTQTFTRAHKGAYMDLLMAQHSNGHMALQDIQTILGPDFDTMWEQKLRAKFVQDDNGLYYNAKMDEVIRKRKAFTESRRKNLSSKTPHMGNGNGNGNRKTIKKDKGGTGEKGELHTRLKNHYLEFYRSKFKIDYYWTGADAGALSSLIKKIKATGGIEDDEQVFNVWVYMLSSIRDKWLLDHCQVGIINSKFNEIIAGIRKGDGVNDMYNQAVQEYERIVQEREKYAGGREKSAGQ